MKRVIPVLLAAAALLAGCERPSPNSVQSGFRGTGMVQVTNPRIDAAKVVANPMPEIAAPAGQDGPKAGAIYQNVKVLGDLSVGEFTRQMLALTQWVAPVQGCAYCHNLTNLADDGLYTKVVSRRMLQMTRAINADWKTHVAATGVTCYTCHRGNNVPQNIWFQAPAPHEPGAFVGTTATKNKAAYNVGLTALPYDPYSPFLLGSEDIRVAGLVPVTNQLQSMLQTDKSYALMIHMSNSLGVNCTFCHNTRNFGTWEGSRPQRTTAWYGIRMARQLNNDYLVPLTSAFPSSRLGVTGDVGKVNCTTCHQGVNKPLYGAPMAKEYPGLAAPATTTVAAALPAEAVAPAVDAPLIK